jgi:hypothetical protein
MSGIRSILTAVGRVSVAPAMTITAYSSTTTRSSAAICACCRVPRRPPCRRRVGAWLRRRPGGPSEVSGFGAPLCGSDRKSHAEEDQSAGEGPRDARPERWRWPPVECPGMPDSGRIATGLGSCAVATARVRHSALTSCRRRTAPGRRTPRHHRRSSPASDFSAPGPRRRQPPPRRRGHSRTVESWSFWASVNVPRDQGPGRPPSSLETMDTTQS